MKPMLAVDYDPQQLRLPMYASPKLDGLRGMVRDGVVYSRSLKPIPSKLVQQKLGSIPALEGMDGELIVGPPTAADCYTQSVSHIMARDKTFAFDFWIFDDFQMPDHTYDDRLFSLTNRLEDIGEIPGVRVLHQTLIKTELELMDYEARCLEQGYEGVILRKIDGYYKHGRSTVREGLLLKVKRFQDGEARIIGFEEQMENTNEKTTNELGRSQRSSHKAGKVGKDTLGALRLRDLTTDVEFSCGTGFDDALRAKIWAMREHYLNTIWKYKFFPVGVKDLPRHPVSIGPRHPEDM